MPDLCPETGYRSYSLMGGLGTQSSRQASVGFGITPYTPLDDSLATTQFSQLSKTAATAANSEYEPNLRVAG